MTSLELATTAELIEELVQRQTFLGVVINSEIRSDGWRGKQYFAIHCSQHLNKEETGRLLEIIANYIEEDVEKDVD